MYPRYRYFLCALSALTITGLLGSVETVCPFAQQLGLPSNITSCCDSLARSGTGTVVCENGDPVEIILTPNLMGFFPENLESLASLRVLRAASTRIGGTIPSSIGKLVNLRVLDLPQNELFGTIPSSIGDLRQLSFLDLSSNLLTGTIPSSIGNLVNLSTFVVPFNQVTGPFPSSFFELRRLTVLDLAGCQFSGTIPSHIGNLVSLEILSFGGHRNVTLVLQHRNKFSGAIPPSIGQLTKLRVLNLRHGLLTGTIPSSFGNLVHLASLDLGDNRLSGSLPSSIGQLKNIVEFDLGVNELAGTIPSSIGDLRQLSFLDLSSNLLTGTIPSSIGNLVHLASLNLGDNRLSGSLPSSIGQLSLLNTLQIGTNELTGTVPLAVFQLLRLQHLSLGENSHLAGDLPLSWVQRVQNPPKSLLLHGTRVMFDALRDVQFHQLVDAIYSHRWAMLGLPAWLTPSNFSKCENTTSLRQLYLSNLEFLGDCDFPILDIFVIYAGKVEYFNFTDVARRCPLLVTVKIVKSDINVLGTPLHVLPNVERLIFESTQIGSLRMELSASDVAIVTSQTLAAIRKTLDISYVPPILAELALRYPDPIINCVVCTLSTFLWDFEFSISGLLYSFHGSTLFPSLLELRMRSCNITTALGFILSRDVFSRRKDRVCTAACADIPVVVTFDFNSTSLRGGTRGGDLVSLLSSGLLRSTGMAKVTTEVRHAFLPGLVVFDVANNAIPGELIEPRAIASVSTLEVLHVGSNFLTDKVPWEQFSLAPLRELNLSHNRFTSSVAVFDHVKIAESWAALQVLDISANEGLRIDVPQWRLRVPTLSTLIASRMPGMIGQLPADMWGLGVSSIRYLKLSGNRNLTGSLPGSVWTVMTQLQIDTDLRQMFLQGTGLQWCELPCHSPVNQSSALAVYLAGDAWIRDPEFVERGLEGAADLSGPPRLVDSGRQPCVQGIRTLDGICPTIRDAGNVRLESAPWECGIRVHNIQPRFTSITALSTVLCHEGASMPCWDSETRELVVSRGSNVTFQLQGCGSQFCGLNRTEVRLVEVNRPWDARVDRSVEVCGNGIRKLIQESEGCLYTAEFAYSDQDGYPIVGREGSRTALCTGAGFSRKMLAMIRVRAPVIGYRAQVDRARISTPGIMPSPFDVVILAENGLEVDVFGRIYFDIQIESGFKPLNTSAIIIRRRRVAEMSGPVAQFDLRDLSLEPKSAVKLNFTLVVQGDVDRLMVGFDDPINVNVCLPASNSYYDAGLRSCTLGCPVGALCDGTRVVCALPGWWRNGSACVEINGEFPNDLLLTFDKCDVGVEGCVGGNTTVSGAGCGNGYTGIKCGTCTDHHILTEMMVCMECPTPGISLLFILGFGVLGACWIGAMVVSQMRSAFVVITLGTSEGDVFDQLSMFLKLLLSSLQVSAVIDRMEIDWAGPLNSLQGTLISVVGALDMIWIRCLIPWLTSLSHRLYLGITGYVVVLVVLNAWLYVIRRQKEHFHLAGVRRRWLFNKTTLVVLVVVILYVLYQQMTLLILYSFFETDVSPTVEGAVKEHYLLSDVTMRVEPPTSEVVSLQRFAKASILLVVLGFPLSLLIWVLLLKRRLETSFTCRALLGLFISGYRQGFEWFEFVRMIRTALTSIVVALPTPAVQLSSISVMLLLELIITMLFRPYAGSSQGLQVLTLSCQTCQFTLISMLCGTSVSGGCTITASESSLQAVAQWILVILDIVVAASFAFEIGTGLIVILSQVSFLRPVLLPVLRAGHRVERYLSKKLLGQPRSESKTLLLKTKDACIADLQKRLEQSSTDLGHVFRRLVVIRRRGMVENTFS